jgi:hypothetical protein
MGHEAAGIVAAVGSTSSASIGRDLSQRFAAEEWGGKIVDRFAHDL